MRKGGEKKKEGSELWSQMDLGLNFGSVLYWVSDLW